MFEQEQKKKLEADQREKAELLLRQKELEAENERIE